MLIPGNRLHIVSSKEHWDELNKTSVDHLSSHAWSKQHFQPKHTFGYEWPDRRDEDGMPVVRAIRTMTGRFQELTPKYLRIMEEEIKEALEKGRREDGSSRLLLWHTINHFASRMNMLMMFGEERANDPEFVDRGLKYIDEVTLVSEAAKNFPAFIVPATSIIRRMIVGRNLNQRHILEAIASDIRKHRANDDPKDKMSSILHGLVRALPHASDSRISHDMNITFVSSTTATPIVILIPTPTSTLANPPARHPTPPRHLHPPAPPPRPPHRALPHPLPPQPRPQSAPPPRKLPRRIHAHALLPLNSHPPRPVEALRFPRRVRRPPR
ncbi:hypothetical protein GRF29_1g1277568 [Pseudopithomyces chartarum]|uniref:Cytochrome P450 n=1 Tax=Pseudopithomyces chartarum TaxID=1892770 RepID=A0AAN6M934_9PLEO|nr:hypothetical protein GRF29_1g1277568 [Pseudopithomyces chartarum]